MKKVLTIILLLSSFFYADAQELSISIGFDIPNAGGTLDGFDDIILADGEILPDTTALVASLNAGPAIQLRYTSWVNDNVGLGLDLEYLPGLMKGDFVTHIAPGVQAVNDVSGKMVSLSPTVTLRTNNSDSKFLYTKFGFVWGISITSKVETEIAAAQTTALREFSKGSGLGFKGGFGARMPLSDKVSFFSELELTSLMHKPKELAVKQSSPQGDTSGTFDIVKTTGPNSPANHMRTVAIPYSSIALNVGIAFSL